MSGSENRPLLSQEVAATQPRSHRSTTVTQARRRTKAFLTSKYGHYTVLGLVSLDVSSIFAELLIQLLTCEGRIAGSNGRAAGDALSVISVIFSSLFMLELLASIWAFGFVFFNSAFHIFDASVITTSFVLDIVLKVVNEDTLEEISSLIIVLRLWRVFKIIEELSAGAEEQMEPLHEKIEDLEKQNEELRVRVQSLTEFQNGR
nr:voltage-gated hydrogen channel 1-like [Quercus suber]